MTKEEKRKELERMLRRCPEVLSPIKVARWSPFGKNRVYEMIHTGELRSFVYQGGYIISKDDLIDYLIEHCDDEPQRAFARGGNNE